MNYQLNSNWKGCPPRVVRIGVIDDDQGSRDTPVELIQNEYPRLTVKGFESIFQAYEGITTYQYLLIDITSVSPSFTLGREWAPIAKYAEEHPATNFIIISAMSRSAIQDVIDECVEYGKIDRNRFSYGGFMWESSNPQESIKHHLNSLISQEDTEWTKTLPKKK